MLRSFYVALTGLNASKEWLDITSDNVANVNTIGFKEERPIFQSLVLQDLMHYNSFNNSIDHTVYGGGVLVAKTFRDFTSGPFKVTGNSTDLAIEGNGFFILQNANGERFYTRDGQFSLSDYTENGVRMLALVHDSGLSVLGINLETHQLEPVTLKTIIPARATTKIYPQDGSNLDPRQNAVDKDFNPTDATTFNSSYSLTVYDSQGAPHSVSLFFKRLNPLLSDGTNNYRTYIVKDSSGKYYFAFKNGSNYYAAHNSGTTVTSLQGTTKLVATGVHVNGINGTVDIYWNRNGNTVKLYAYDGNTYYELDVNNNTALNNITETHVAAVKDVWQSFVLLRTESGWQNLISNSDTASSEGGYAYDLLIFNSDGSFYQDWNGDAEITLNVPNGNNLSLQKVVLSGLVQYPVDFALGFQQDGYPPGRIQSVSVGRDGTVTGVYSNGVSKNLYRLQLAYFNDLQALESRGSNLFTAPSTLNPVIENAGVSSRIRSGTLELSNVDIAQEMINMITAEKAYQANAKVVQTGQTILDTTINLKR